MENNEKVQSVKELANILIDTIKSYVSEADVDFGVREGLAALSFVTGGIIARAAKDGRLENAIKEHCDSIRTSALLQKAVCVVEESK